MEDIAFETTEHVGVAAVAAAVASTMVPNDDGIQLLVGPSGIADYADFCRTQQVDLVHSVVARDRVRAIVGIAVLARRGERGYCADFGVAPAWRRRGLGHGLMAAFLSVARAEGLRTVQLEVRPDNAPALRIYERAGFQARRNLVGLVAAAGSLSPAALLADRAVRGAPTAAIASLSVPPACWEREPSALLLATAVSGLIAGPTGHERAWLIHRQPDARGRFVLLHVGAAPAARIEDVQTLLGFLQRRGATGFVLGGEPEGSHVHGYLETLGFTVQARRTEMSCVL